MVLYLLKISKQKRRFFSYADTILLEDGLDLIDAHDIEVVDYVTFPGNQIDTTGEEPNIKYHATAEYLCEGIEKFLKRLVSRKHGEFSESDFSTPFNVSRDVINKSDNK